MSLMKTRNPSKSLTTCPTMNKIVHFPGISHAFPGISHAQIQDIPRFLLCHAVPGGRKPGLQDLQGIRCVIFHNALVDEEIGFIYVEYWYYWYW